MADQGPRVFYGNPPRWRQAMASTSMAAPNFKGRPRSHRVWRFAVAADGGKTPQRLTRRPAEAATHF
jgi:hypothetical protein